MTIWKLANNDHFTPPHMRDSSWRPSSSKTRNIHYQNFPSLGYHGLKFSKEELAQVFMLSKAVGHELYRVQTCAWLHLRWALIPVKPTASGFTLHDHWTKNTGKKTSHIWKNTFDFHKRQKEELLKGESTQWTSSWHPPVQQTCWMDSIVFLLSHKPTKVVSYVLTTKPFTCTMHSLPWRQTSQAIFSFNPCSSRKANKFDNLSLQWEWLMRLGTREWLTGPSKATVREHTAWTSLNTLNFEIIGYSSKEKERKNKYILSKISIT